MEEKEIILIKIDPETLEYTSNFTFSYIDDIYTVLRDLVNKFETGNIHNNLNLEDTYGNQLSKEYFIKTIAKIKERIDQQFEGPAELTNKSNQNFRD